jgi:hypothetical protein
MFHLWSPAQHSPWRWPAALFLLVNAAIHLYLAPMHLIEAPYIGALFIALSTACIVLAVLLSLLDNILVWVTAGTMSLLALMAFLISRTVGLPQISDDIGNWTDPLGYPNMAVEVLTIIVTTAVLRSERLRSPRTSPVPTGDELQRQPSTDGRPNLRLNMRRHEGF